MNRWFRHQLRVRYQETDQMGVVYYANYLTWFEIGRTELVRKLGLPYKEIEAAGLFLPVVDAQLSFRKPARYDDRIGVFLSMPEITHVRLGFAYEVRRMAADAADLGEPSDFVFEPQGELLLTGSTKHVWVNRDWRPSRVDRASPELYRMLSEYSEGQEG